MNHDHDPRHPVTIAKTILHQIGVNTLMCIGSHDRTVVNPSGDFLGGVTFRITPNPKMKQHGRVTVLLNGTDTYHVKIETCRGKVLLDKNDIYADNLGGPSGVIEGITG